MRLFVTIPNGRKLTLDAESDALVSDLKAKVFAALPTAKPAMQTIGKDGQPLGPDDHTLQHGALYVDSRDTTVEHIGELVIPLASGAIQPDSVLGDLYDLIAQGTGDGGRSRDPQQITVFKNGGGAHLDLMVAHHLMSLSL